MKTVYPDRDIKNADWPKRTNDRSTITKDGKIVMVEESKVEKAGREANRATPE